MRALRIGIAGSGRVQAHAMAAARGKHGPAEGDADGPVHGHRGLREGTLARQSRAPGSGCGGASGPAAPASRSRSNPSRTLRTMSRRGPAVRERGLRGTPVPRVPHSQGDRTVHRQPRHGRLTEPAGRAQPAARSGPGRNLRFRGGGSPRAASAESSPAVLARGGSRRSLRVRSPTSPE